MNCKFRMKDPGREDLSMGWNGMGWIMDERGLGAGLLIAK